MNNHTPCGSLKANLTPLPEGRPKLGLRDFNILIKHKTIASGGKVVNLNRKGLTIKKKKK